MNNNDKKVPKIRFKGYTDAWEQFRIGDVFKVTRGNVLAVTETTLVRSKENQYPVYSSQTKDNGLMGYYNTYLFDTAITWTTDGANAGTVNFRDEKFYSTNVNGVLLSREGYACKATAEALNLVAWKYVSKVGNPKLMNNVMSDISIGLPSSFEELSMISRFYDSIDNLITLHQRKLENTQKMKKTLLSSMFPKNNEKVPEIRFKGYTDAWEQEQLGRVLIEFSEKSKIENQYRILSSTNVGMELRNGRISGQSNIGYKIIDNGDLVLSPQNLWLGNININNIGKGLVSPSYKTFKFKAIDSNFIKPQLRSPKMIENYKNSSTQGASVVRRNLDSELFEKIIILIPTQSEQTQIGILFKTLDNLITLHQRELENLKKIKKTMLKDMFV